jgi:surface protein
VINTLHKYFPKNNNELANIIKEKYYKNSEELDCRDIDVSLINDFAVIFRGLEDVKKIDITGWDTSKSMSFNSTFSKCKKLEEIIGIEYLDVRNVKFFEYTFNKCESLKQLDLSKWELNKSPYCTFTFNECSKLIKLYGVENWDKFIYDINKANYTFGMHNKMFLQLHREIIPDWYLKLHNLK